MIKSDKGNILVDGNLFDVLADLSTIIYSLKEHIDEDLLRHAIDLGFDADADDEIDDEIVKEKRTERVVKNLNELARQLKTLLEGADDE